MILWLKVFTRKIATGLTVLCLFACKATPVVQDECQCTQQTSDRTLHVTQEKTVRPSYILKLGNNYNLMLTELIWKSSSLKAEALKVTGTRLKEKSPIKFCRTLRFYRQRGLQADRSKRWGRCLREGELGAEGACQSSSALTTLGTAPSTCAAHLLTHKGSPWRAQDMNQVLGPPRDHLEIKDRDSGEIP